MIITVGTLSGGVGSWAACRRWIDANGTDGLALLFADTGEEDPDTYRFLDDAAADLGAPLYRVTSGRDIWEVFRAHRWIGNSKLAHCSWDLKTEPSRAWIADHPGITGIIVGIDWSEPGAPALTLTQLRQRAESHAPQLDLFEEGGCGCFT